MTLDEARTILAHPAQHGGLQSAEVAEAIGLMIAAGELREPTPVSAQAPSASLARRYRAVGNLEVGEALQAPPGPAVDDPLEGQ